MDFCPSQLQFYYSIRLTLSFCPASLHKEMFIFFYSFIYRLPGNGAELPSVWIRRSSPHFREHEKGNDFCSYFDTTYGHILHGGRLIEVAFCLHFVLNNKSCDRRVVYGWGVFWEIKSHSIVHWWSHISKKILFARRLKTFTRPLLEGEEDVFVFRLKQDLDA